MRKILFLIIIYMCAFSTYSQRQAENLDRGVVAIKKSSSQVFISWRLLATDPDNISFNVYQGSTKLNTSPITASTNLLANLSTTSAATYSVRPVINGVEKPADGSWEMSIDQPANRVVKNIDFAPLPAGWGKMRTKYCWVGDLNGDGKFDFVIDRVGGSIADEEETTADTPPVSKLIEAYTSDGVFMWRIYVGTNVPTMSSGHADQVTVYDMNGDGFAEVLFTSSEGTTFPDGTQIKNSDGTVKDYNVSGMTTHPQFITIVDGRTGNLINKISVPNFSSFTSTSSAKCISGHFIIAYYDGINPSLIYQYKNDVNGGICSIGFSNGNLITNWSRLSTSTEIGRAGHQVRVADTDGDGKDEFIEVSYVIDHDGTLLPYPSDNLRHGDRHTLADIDPDRPGLEHFSIQQSSVMGMGLWDPATSEVIKGNYLSSIGDVGRGICMAAIPTVRGLQYWSTMNSYQIYDSKGEALGSTKGSFSNEPLWWGPDLTRYHCISVGGGGTSLAFEKFVSENSRMERVTPNFYSESGISELQAYGSGRPAFWGDILGDWREELVLVRKDTTGFAIVSNWDVTSTRLYCLMQNPAYRCQTTAKGYYQSADVDYFMATDMVPSPIAPIQLAEEYITSASLLTNAVNGKSIMFDIRNPNSVINLNGSISPSRLWLMNPREHDYVFDGTGTFSGNMDIVKSMQGSVTINGNHTYTGITRISEGKIIVNGSLQSNVVVDARGVIAGNCTLNGGLTLNEGLNYAGGRIEPNGKITIVGNVSGSGRNTFAFDVNADGTINDSIVILGNFNVTGNNNFLEVNFSGGAPIAGSYTLITYSGTTGATPAKFKIRGFEGKPYNIIIGNNKVVLEIISTRSASSVVWSGQTSSTWDYRSINFRKESGEYFFVPNDTVLFNDDAINKNIVITTEQMSAGNTFFANTTGTYTLSGTGGIGGTGFLKKENAGTLKISTVNNTYTGETQILGGTVEAVNIQNAGVESSFGKGSSVQLSNVTLKLTGSSATDRNIKLGGDSVILNTVGNASIYTQNSISGANTNLVKEGLGVLNLNTGNEFKSIIFKEGRISLATLDANRTGLGNGTTLTFLGDSSVIIPSIAMKDNNSDSNTATPFGNPIVVPSGKIGRINFPMRWKVSSNLTGAGRLQLSIPYIRLDFRGNWNSFTGTIQVLSSTDGGQFRINNDYGYSKSTFDLANGTQMYHMTSGKTIKVGAITGAGSLNGGLTTWQIGGNNISTTFDGVISGSSSKLEKEGTGELKLTGTNTYTGSTTVKTGTLVAASTNSVGTYNMTVNSGATLSTEDGICQALNIGGLFDLKSGSTLIMEVNPTSGASDILNVAKNAGLNGTLKLVIVGSGEFSVGNIFTLFNVQEGITGDIILPTLPIGMKWDKSMLYSSGMLAIVSDASAVDKIYGSKEIESIEYYNILGYKINENSKEVVIQRIIFTDGSFVTKKNFIKEKLF
ncbi:MAG: autotransporter-associated beta strand repeat-containing protein [Paludibacter sp.]|nr:autotransporter-associated beta strand repeat-containing protein [Paludibacter sp.]